MVVRPYNGTTYHCVCRTGRVEPRPYAPTIDRTTVGGGVPDAPPYDTRCTIAAGHMGPALHVIPNQCSHWRGSDNLSRKRAPLAGALFLLFSYLTRASLSLHFCKKRALSMTARV